MAARREQKVRVFVVDDDPDFVEAAKLSLAADRRIEVVGGATGGEEAVKQAAALRPEVVAMVSGSSSCRHMVAMADASVSP